MRVIHISKDAAAQFFYTNDYEGIYIETYLSQEETEIIREMISHSKVVRDKGCHTVLMSGIYIEFSDGNKVKKYYIACDTCPKLQYGLDGVVMNLKDWEIDQLHSILGGYGAVLLCVKKRYR